MNTATLQNTSWLAKRLNISQTTVERLRASNPNALPPHITIGKSIRYNSQVVEKWLDDRLNSSTNLSTGN